jgi:hypothetical protein
MLLVCGCGAGTDSSGGPLGISTVGNGSGGSATPTPSPTPAGSGGTSGSATPTPSPTITPTGTGGGPTSAPSAAATAGALSVSPDPINFGLTSVLGSTSTATVSQANYTGPYTLPANAIVCSNGITNIPFTASMSGSTLSVTLGLLGVTGICTITVDGASGTSGTELVNLAVPIGTPVSTGPLAFSVDPINFNVLNAVTGSSATTTISEAGYSGSFTLPANPISCPFDLLPLTQLSATIANGNQLTLNTGLLNVSLLGSCSVTVEDSNMHTGAETVNFELL